MWVFKVGQVNSTEVRPYALHAQEASSIPDRTGVSPEDLHQDGPCGPIYHRTGAEMHSYLLTKETTGLAYYWPERPAPAQHSLGGIPK